MPVRVQDTCGRRTTDWRHEKRKSAQERNFFAKNLVQYRKRHYLCTANEAGQGHSPAGLERCSHIAEVIGSNPIVPTSQHERGGRTFMERPPLLCMRTAPRAHGGFRNHTHKLRADATRTLPHTHEAAPTDIRQHNPPHAPRQHCPHIQASQSTRPGSTVRASSPDAESAAPHQPTRRHRTFVQPGLNDDRSALHQPTQRPALTVQPRLNEKMTRPLHQTHHPTHKHAARRTHPSTAPQPRPRMPHPGTPPTPSTPPHSPPQPP